MAGQLGPRTSIGKLRHRLQIQSPREVLDAMREPVQTWATDVTVWGRMEPVTVLGKELMQAERVQEIATHQATIRFRTGMTAKKRMLWRSQGQTRTFNIVAVFEMTGDENYILCVGRMAEATD